MLGPQFVGYNSLSPCVLWADVQGIHHESKRETEAVYSRYPRVFLGHRKRWVPHVAFRQLTANVS